MNYVKSANMGKVQAHFEEAKRLTETTYVKGHVAASLGQVANVPDDASGWILLFNRTSTLAPGGGPAYALGSGDAVTA